ncbi:hypothetical protein Tco_0557427 [Tanacetum coccineum]
MIVELDSRLVIGPLLLEIPVAANEVKSVFGETSTSRSFSKNRAPIQDEHDLPEGSIIEDHSDIDDDLDCLRIQPSSSRTWHARIQTDDYADRRNTSVGLFGKLQRVMHCEKEKGLSKSPNEVSLKNKKEACQGSHFLKHQLVPHTSSWYTRYSGMSANPYKADVRCKWQVLASRAQLPETQLMDSINRLAANFNSALI